MTDHDRGAYTPQPDAPLQFDARGPRGRKPMPMTLIGSGAVLVVVLGALAMHYRHDTGKDGVRPVGEPVAQVKAAAPASAQPKDAAGVDVLNASAPAAQTAAAPPAKTPNFLPPPETPKPRAQLTVQTAENAAPAVRTLPTTTTVPLAPAPAQVAVVKAPQAYHAPGLAPVQAPVAVAKTTPPPIVKAAAPVAKPAALAAAAVKPATSAPVPKPAVAAIAAKPAAVGAHSGAVVQIGAFSSTAQSESGFAAVSSAMASEMGGKAKRVETVEVGGKTFFRTSVTGFSSRNAADAFCRALAAKGHTCFAKG